MIQILINLNNAYADGSNYGKAKVGNQWRFSYDYKAKLPLIQAAQVLWQLLLILLITK